MVSMVGLVLEFLPRKPVIHFTLLNYCFTKTSHSLCYAVAHYCFCIFGFYFVSAYAKFVSLSFISVFGYFGVSLRFSLRKFRWTHIRQIKALTKTLKKDKILSCPFLIVDEVTIFEPFEQPTDNEMLSQMMMSENIYHNRIVYIMKQSTQEYYNMRMILGLKCT